DILLRYHTRQDVALLLCVFFFQAEDGIRDGHVTGVQTCALPIFAPAFADATMVSGDSPVASAKAGATFPTGWVLGASWGSSPSRSEERRVGKEWRDGKAP